MKPHEEQWVPGTHWIASKTARGGVVAEVHVPEEQRAQYVALIAAAPDMARALLALARAAESQSVYGCIPHEVQLAESALRKAGVL